MKDGFGEVLMRAATGALRGAALEWKREPSVCVVMAAAGYPGTVKTGDSITGIEKVTGATVFQAGTRIINNVLETSGGRVLGLTAGGDTLRSAIDHAYAEVRKIHFEGMHYRRDIGQKGLKRW